MAVSTLLQIRDRAKSLADLQDSTFVSDAEWDAFINDAGGELWDLLSLAYEPGYSQARAELSYDSASFFPGVALPSDFFKLIGVDIQDSSSDWLPLRSAGFSDRDLGGRYWPVVTGRWCPWRYILQATALDITPRPDDGTLVRLHYIPEWLTLAADGDSFAVPERWEAFVVYHAAQSALMKTDPEGTTPSAFERRIEQMRARLQLMAQDRDLGEARSVEKNVGLRNFWRDYD